MHAEQPAIDIRGLVRKYKRTDAVDGLNLRVQPGRCYGFFGRNGAGKTTTIKAIGGAVSMATIAAIVNSVAYRLIVGPYGQNQGSRLLSSFQSRSIDIYIWSAVLLSVMCLWFALANHRSTEWQFRRVAMQVLALTITAVCCLALPLFLLTQVPSP